MRVPLPILPRPGDAKGALGGAVVAVDLNRPMSEVRKQLSSVPVKTRLSLTGTLVVARDIEERILPEVSSCTIIAGFTRF